MSIKKKIDSIKYGKKDTFRCTIVIEFSDEWSRPLVGTEYCDWVSFMWSQKNPITIYGAMEVENGSDSIKELRSFNHWDVIEAFKWVADNTT
jgi:hypothetical protein